MSDYIEVPDSVMREMLEALLAGFPKGSTSLSDVPVGFIDGFIDMVKDAGGCDHSVGICACGEEAIAAELLLLKDGKTTCRICGGDGYTWDADKYEAARVQAAKEGYDASEGEGAVPCFGCDGKGIVRVGISRTAPAF